MRNIKSNKRLIISIILLVAIEIVLGSAWKFVGSDSIISISDVAITADLLKLVLRTIIIFWLIDYKYIYLKLVALFYLSNGIFEIILRFIKLYFGYFDYEKLHLLTNPFLYTSIGYLFILLFWSLHAHKRFTNESSDPYNPKHTYLLFKKPDDFLGLLLTIFTAPVASVSVVDRGKHYFFRQKVPGYQVRDFIERTLPKYRLVRIPTTRRFTRQIKLLVGLKYKVVSNNCVTILCFTDLTVGVMDFVPVFFMARHTKL